MAAPAQTLGAAAIERRAPAMPHPERRAGLAAKEMPE